MNSSWKISIEKDSRWVFFATKSVWSSMSRRSDVWRCNIENWMHCKTNSARRNASRWSECHVTSSVIKNRPKRKTNCSTDWNMFDRAIILLRIFLFFGWSMWTGRISIHCTNTWNPPFLRRRNTSKITRWFSTVRNIPTTCDGISRNSSSTRTDIRWCASTVMRNRVSFDNLLKNSFNCKKIAERFVTKRRRRSTSSERTNTEKTSAPIDLIDSHDDWFRQPSTWWPNQSDFLLRSLHRCLFMHSIHRSADRRTRFNQIDRRTPIE